MALNWYNQRDGPAQILHLLAPQFRIYIIERTIFPNPTFHYSHDSKRIHLNKTNCYLHISSSIFQQPQPANNKKKSKNFARTHTQVYRNREQKKPGHQPKNSFVLTTVKILA